MCFQNDETAFLENLEIKIFQNQNQKMHFLNISDASHEL